MFNLISGELKYATFEEKYLDEVWPRTRRQIQIVLGAAAIGVFSILLANINDVRFLDALVPMIIVRSLQLVCIVITVAATFRSKRPELIVPLIAVVELVTVLAEGVNFSFVYGPQMRGNDSIGTPFLVLLIFVFYTLLPGRFIFTTLICLTAMFSHSLQTYLIMDRSISVTAYVFIMFLFVNVLGFGYGRYINRLQRQDYVSRNFLEREVSKRKKAEQAAIASAELAEVASQQKSKFLAVAGHDLRQPLHALGLWVDTLQERIQSTASNDALLLTEKVVSAKDSLTELLDRLLHISHLDAGVTDIQNEALFCSEILEGLESRFASAASKQEMTFHVLPCSLVIDSDRLLLDRILDNLVDNGIKYGSPRGRITVGIRRSTTHAMFQVWNTGEGIAQSELPKIFEEFHQVKHRPTSSLRGLGLGLSIVKRLADLMQMSIEARSEEGKLTVFSLAVPISTAKPALQKKTPAITNYGQLTQRIMVLDDDADVREAIAQLLIRWGAEVDLCRNRAEAFEAASIQAPDIIITDRQLAENENGIDVVQAMIDSLKLDCEVIVMTADTTPEAIRQTSLSGFKALNKPVKPAQLRIVISNLG